MAVFACCVVMQACIFLHRQNGFRLRRNMRVLWYKRDLRVEDHLPLYRCARRGPVLPIYIYEPRIIHSPEYGANQHAFIEDSLEELDAALRALGGRLIRLHGHARDVLQGIHTMCPITELHSHMETGNALTYRRDKVVAAWCRAEGVTWMKVRLPTFNGPIVSGMDGRAAGIRGCASP